MGMEMLVTHRRSGTAELSLDAARVPHCSTVCWDPRYGLLSPSAEAVAEVRARAATRASEGTAAVSQLAQAVEWGGTVVEEREPVGQEGPPQCCCPRRPQHQGMAFSQKDLIGSPPVAAVVTEAGVVQGRCTAGGLRRLGAVTSAWETRQEEVEEVAGPAVSACCAPQTATTAMRSRGEVTYPVTAAAL